MTFVDANTAFAIGLIASTIVGLGVWLWLDSRVEPVKPDRYSPPAPIEGDRFAMQMARVQHERLAKQGQDRGDAEPASKTLPYAMRDFTGFAPRGWDGDRDKF